MSCKINAWPRILPRWTLSLKKLVETIMHKGALLVIFTMLASSYFQTNYKKIKKLFHRFMRWKRWKKKHLLLPCIKGLQTFKIILYLFWSYTLWVSPPQTPRPERNVVSPWFCSYWLSYNCKKKKQYSYGGGVWMVIFWPYLPPNEWQLRIKIQENDQILKAKILEFFIYIRVYSFRR